MADRAGVTASGHVVPVRAYLFLTAVMVGLYLAMPLVVTEVASRPTLLVAVLLGGAALGAAVAHVETAMSRSREQLRRVHSAMRFTIMGAVGVGLILAQTLSITTIHWMLLGLAAVPAAAAGHAWVKTRRS